MKYDVIKACEWKDWVGQPGDTVDPAAAGLTPAVVDRLVALEAIRAVETPPAE